MHIFSQLRNQKGNFINDIMAGIVVALVSIPISMGYAQIAGLPAVYGIYGSIFPIIIFAFLTTTRQFVVGVDAMPAAMIGGLLVEIGVTAESDEAMSLVPVMALLVAVWFVIFFVFKAGRIVKFISTPVMGGFISGVGITIILMQIPKLFGGSAGTGEVFVLVANIIEQSVYFNPVAFAISIFTIAVILICKRFIPKLPMTVLMLFFGGIVQAFVGLDRFGVKLLSSVNSGLPKISIPDISILWQENMTVHIPAILLQSVSIAAVIMAQSLLASGSYAMKYNDSIDNNKELLAYGVMNVAGAMIGCCPVNGSVSRTKIADNFGCKSQLMSISAGLSMLLILLFGTSFFGYLPVPVLTAIVMTALMGIVDTAMMKRLFISSRNEFFIFMLSMMGVLIFGTVYGVIIGCLLSFWEVAIRTVNPPTAFVGRIPGRGNFYSLSRNTMARPLKNTVIYRFSGNLFFANIDKFILDIEGAIKEDTHQVVVDARGIGSIDVTALDKLMGFAKVLKEREIKFYLTEHEGSLNDEIRRLGGASLIEGGVARRTITLALRDAGLEKPYELEERDAGLEKPYELEERDAGLEKPYELEERDAGLEKPYELEDKDDNKMTMVSENVIEADDRLSEFEWAFGEQAEEYMEMLADKTAEEMLVKINEGKTSFESLEAHGAKTGWGMLGLFDENEFWDHLEVRVLELSEKGKISGKDVEWINERIEKRRESGEERLLEINPHAKTLLAEHRKRMLEHLKEHDIEEYEHLQKLYLHLKRKDIEATKSHKDSEEAKD